MRGFQKYGRTWILTVVFQRQTIRQGKNELPDGLNWLCYFAGTSKSHRENSISFIFLESPHQVDMKNIVKSSKHFFGYFNTLETHSEFNTVHRGRFLKIASTAVNVYFCGNCDELCLVGFNLSHHVQSTCLQFYHSSLPAWWDNSSPIWPIIQ